MGSKRADDPCRSLLIGLITGFFGVMPYHCRFLNPRLKNLMCKSEFFVLF